MQQITKFGLTLLLVIFAATFAGCGGGGGGGGGDDALPTDPTLEFQTFPASYFTQGYTESYSLTGTSNLGDTYVGSVLFETQAEDVFDGTPAIPVDGLLEFTNTLNNAFISTIAVSYFSTFSNDRRLLGEEFPNDGVLSFATSTEPLPEFATIDDFGAVGTYSASDGTTSSVSWRLANANNGRAYLIIAWNYFDQLGDLEATEEQEYLIEPDGTRLAITIRFFIVGVGTITLSGNRN